MDELDEPDAEPAESADYEYASGAPTGRREYADNEDAAELQLEHADI